jgi:hypothetical protein
LTSWRISAQPLAKNLASFRRCSAGDIDSMGEPIIVGDMRYFA